MAVTVVAYEMPFGDYLPHYIGMGFCPIAYAEEGGLHVVLSQYFQHARRLYGVGGVIEGKGYHFFVGDSPAGRFHIHTRAYGSRGIYRGCYECDNGYGQYECGNCHRLPHSMTL